MTMSDNHKYRVQVDVQSSFVPNQSDPANDRYVFAYRITITNLGTVPAQLRTRHWIITDATEKVIEVEGDGVVGKQPQLAPGSQFTYTSGAVIETPVGTMRGSYQMLADDGTKFEAAIPPFVLSVPGVLH